MRNFWRLLLFIKPFGGWMVLSILLGVATIASAIGLMGAAAYLIASASLHPSIAELQVAIVGVRFFGISRGVFRYLERLVSHTVNLKLLTSLRVWFYQKIEPLAPAGLTTYQGGDLLHRAVADIDYLENFYVRVVAPPIVALIITLGVGVFIGNIDLRMGAVLVLGLVLEGAGVPWLSFILNRKPGSALVEERGRLSTALVDGIQGLGELLAYGRGADQLALVEERSRKLAVIQKKMSVNSGIISAINMGLNNLTLLGILVLAVSLVSEGQMDVVVLAVVTLVVISSFEAVAPLGVAAQHLEASQQSGRHLFELADAKPLVHEEKKPLHKVGSDLRIKNLNFTYADDLEPALVNFNLDLPIGKHIGIVGASGSGKSTLINLLLRFWNYPDGAINLGGVELKNISFDEAREAFNVLSSTSMLFSSSIRENLLLAKPNASDDEMWASLAKAQLDHFVAGLPQGLNTWIGESGTQLSGGERQRLLVARAMLRDAPILILDEPTVNLDQETEQELIRSLFKLAEGRSAIWISHDLKVMAQLDEILVMKAGQVVERGSHIQLMGLKGTYHQLWKMQHQLIH
jgi:ATP-binding cassette subfamily C protein CydC